MGETLHLKSDDVDSRQPDLIAAIGEALQRAGQEEKAQTLLERAVKDFPESWRCWAEYAEVFANKSARALTGESSRQRDSLRSRAYFVNHPAEPFRIEAAEKYLAQAETCSAKSVAAAPGSRAAWLKRREFHIFSYGGGRSDLQAMKGETGVHSMGGLFSPEVLEDSRRLSLLDPLDYKAVLMRMHFAYMGGRFRIGGGIEGDFISQIPVDDRKNFLEGLSHLEQIARKAKPQEAGMAALYRGIFQFMAQNDEEGALQSYRLAVTVNPDFEDGWLCYLKQTSQKREPQPLLIACREALAHCDTPQIRLSLARAYALNGEWAAAEQEVRNILGKSPDDFLANLTMAIIVIRREDSPQALTRSETFLHKAGAILSANDPPARQVDYRVIAGILACLRDSQAARKWFEEALTIDSRNSAAIKALAILDAAR